MESTFIDITRKVYGEMHNYGAVSKAIVDMVAEVTPLRVVSVRNNTTSTYDALLELTGFPDLIYLGNNGQWFFFGLATRDGVVVNTSSSVHLGYSNETSAETGNIAWFSNIRVVFSSIGGIISGLQINPGSSNAVGAVVSWATSERTGETIGFFSQFSINGAGYSAYNFPNYRAGTSSVYDSAIASTIPINQYNSTSFDDSALGAACAWVPVRTIGYILPSKWFGRLLWGGRYTMYCLTTSDLATPVTTKPGIDYVIDGKIYKAVFNELYDFRED